MINPTVVEKHFLRRGMSECSIWFVLFLAIPDFIALKLFMTGTGTSDHHSLTQYRACVEACFSPEELQYVFTKYNLRGQHLQ